MTHSRTPHRLARRLLLTAALLPFTPLAAQDAVTPVPAPPVTVTTPPAAEPAPAPAPSAAPVQPALRNGVPVGGTPSAEPAPAEEAAADEPSASPARTERRATQRAAERPRARARVAAPASTPAPKPAAEPAPAVTDTPAPVALSAPPAPAEPPIAAPAATPVESNAPAEDRIGLADTWPLLAAALLAIGGLAMLLLSRRRHRRREAEMEQAYYDEAPVYHEQPVAVEPAMAAVPAMVAPLAHANDEPGGMTAVPAARAAAAASGRPWLELMMRPVRAGVGDEDARVEFELTVANQGSAPARDVRVSTFMLAGGSSDMEQSLIEQPAEPQLAEHELDPGDGRSIESAVALPRHGLRGDAILPVVVADARYRLPDGSEGRTSARFAVGVPVDGDLAHFDVENPSGLHEGVEARLHGELERV
jgi:hypothetical protein